MISTHLCRPGKAARNARQHLQAAGLPAIIRVGDSQGQPFWRVVIGPARDLEENMQILATARALGFGDAYHVRN